MQCKHKQRGRFMVTRFARPTALVSIVCLSVAVTFQLAALRAAGMNGTPPPHAAQFRARIGTLTANGTWFVATGFGRVLVRLAGMMVSGDIRAPEKLFRVAGGIVVILVLIPAVLARAPRPQALSDRARDRDPLS